MMPPTFDPTGSEATGITAPDGSEVQEVRDPDGNVVFSAGPAIPDSAVLHYKFDDSSDTTTAVDSVGSATASINGASYTTDSAVGSNALSFDGNDDFVETNSNQGYGISDGTNSSFTISAWVYWDGSTDTPQGIFASADADDLATGNPPYAIQLGGGNNDEMGVAIQNTNNNFQAAFSGSSFPSGEWVHVTGEYDGSTLETYLNNSLVASNTINSNLFDADERPLVGVQKPADNRYWTGKIDDVFLLDTKISDSERDTLYQRGPV